MKRKTQWSRLARLVRSTFTVKEAAFYKSGTADARSCVGIQTEELR